MRFIFYVITGSLISCGTNNHCEELPELEISELKDPIVIQFNPQKKMKASDDIQIDELKELNIE